MRFQHRRWSRQVGDCGEAVHPFIDFDPIHDDTVGGLEQLFTDHLTIDDAPKDDASCDHQAQVESFTFQSELILAENLEAAEQHDSDLSSAIDSLEHTLMLNDTRVIELPSLLPNLVWSSGLPQSSLHSIFSNYGMTDAEAANEPAVTLADNTWLEELHTQQTNELEREQETSDVVDPLWLSSLFRQEDDALCSSDFFHLNNACMSKRDDWQQSSLMSNLQSFTKQHLNGLTNTTEPNVILSEVPTPSFWDLLEMQELERAPCHMSVRGSSRVDESTVGAGPSSRKTTSAISPTLNEILTCRTSLTFLLGELEPHSSPAIDEDMTSMVQDECLRSDVLSLRGGNPFANVVHPFARESIRHVDDGLLLTLANVVEQVRYSHDHDTCIILSAGDRKFCSLAAFTHVSILNLILIGVCERKCIRAAATCRCPLFKPYHSAF